MKEPLLTKRMVILSSAGFILRKALDDTGKLMMFKGLGCPPQNIT